MHPPHHLSDGIVAAAVVVCGLWLMGCGGVSGDVLAGISFPSSLFTLNATEDGCVWRPVSGGPEGEMAGGAVDRTKHIYYMFGGFQMWGIDLDTGQVLSKTFIQVGYFSSPVCDSVTGEIYMSAINETAGHVYSVCKVNKERGYCDVISTIAYSMECYQYCPSWNQVDQQYIKVWDIPEGTAVLLEELATVDVTSGNIVYQVPTEWTGGLTTYDNANKRLLYLSTARVGVLDQVTGKITLLCNFPEIYNLDSAVVSDSGDTLYVSGMFPDNSIVLMSYDLNKCAVNYYCSGPNGLFYAGLGEVSRLRLLNDRKQQDVENLHSQVKALSSLMEKQVLPNSSASHDTIVKQQDTIHSLEAKLESTVNEYEQQLRYAQQQLKEVQNKQVSYRTHIKKKEGSKRRQMLVHLSNAADQLELVNATAEEHKVARNAVYHALGELLCVGSECNDPYQKTTFHSLRAVLLQFKEYILEELAALKTFCVTSVSTVIECVKKQQQLVDQQELSINEMQHSLESLNTAHQNSIQHDNAQSESMLVELQQLREQCNTLMAEKTATSNELRTLQKKAHSQHTKNVELQKQLDQVTSEVRITKEEQNRLIMKLNDAQQLLSTKDNALTSLRADFTKLEALHHSELEKFKKTYQELEQSQQKMSILELSKVNAETALGQLRQDYDINAQKITASIKEKNGEVTSALQQVGNLRNQVKEKTEEIVTLSKQLEDCEIRFKENLAVLAEHNMQLDLKVGDLKEQVCQFQKSASQAEANFTALISTLCTTLPQLPKSLQSALLSGPFDKATLDLLSQFLKQMQKTFTSTQEQLDNTNAKLFSTQSRNVLLEQEVSNLQTKANHVSEMETKLSTLRQRMQAYLSSVMDKDKEIEQLHGELEHTCTTGIAKEKTSNV
ncbi:hypothetical protein Pelo_13703 [Pelomyxa schiedti]|nr:hypothetical protein Pelo_13703 [Pelomyxa schiedti]